MLALGIKPEALPDFSRTHRIRQFRRQDRILIRAQVERTYKMDGKTVARNRRKRMDQRNDSLEEWYQKQADLYGRKEAERLRSQLKVIKSYRRYNDPDRVMPGTVFLFRGKRYVLQGRITNGAYFKAV